MASNTKNNEIKLEEEILLEEIKTRIIKKLPEEVKLANIEFEGPEVVIYTKNPDIIADNGDLIRTLAKDLRKRIIIRSDKSVLLDKEETIAQIEEMKYNVGYSTGFLPLDFLNGDCFEIQGKLYYQIGIVDGSINA